VIRAVRSSCRIPISVDTHYGSVAETAVKEGASLINDISGGTIDSSMFATVARLGVPYVVMHIRGTPKTMLQAANTTYKDVVADVRNYLNKRVADAVASGIFRWNIIADPGIGFAKQGPHSLRLMRALGQVRPAHLPLLVGPSRKSFIGRILVKGGRVKEADATSDSESRIWGTAACVTACIAEGCDIIRVHDVKQMSYVRALADEIYRGTTISTQL